MNKLPSLFTLIFIYLSPPLNAQDINNGRVAFYPFNGNAIDAAGTNHGTNNGATLISDRFGNANSAYNFDGIDDYIEIPHNEVLNFGVDDNFSISFWVKIATQANVSGNNDIISKWIAHPSTGYPYAIRYYDDNGAKEQFHKKILCIRYDTDAAGCDHAPRVESPCALPMEQWTHIVFRKTGEELTMFENGALVSTGVDATTASCGGTKNVSALYFGMRGGHRRHFKGAIDDVSFYNRSITNEEVKLLFEENDWTAPINPEKDTDIISFEFPEQIGTTIIDKASHSISVTVECQASLSELIASFTLSEGATAEVNGVNQTSGTTVNNFSKPVIYKVRSQNTCYQQDWSVDIHREELDQNEVDAKTAFQSFSFLEQTQAPILNFDDHSVAIEVSCKADLSQLNADFTVPNGAQAKVNGIKQVSSTSVNNFEKPVVYVISTNDGCAVQQWTVSVSLEQTELDAILGDIIPNVITPNNDKRNDTWKIVSDTESFNIHVKIFNRWGSLVFEDNDYKNNWGGETLRSGVYFYTITSKCSTSNQYKGWLHVIK